MSKQKKNDYNFLSLEKPGGMFKSNRSFYQQSFYEHHYWDSVQKKKAYKATLTTVKEKKAMVGSISKKKK